MSKIKVFIVDDHAIVRMGLKALLSSQTEMEVIGEAGTSAEALRGVTSLQPDVVLMDVRIPGEGGIETTRQLTRQFSSIKVVILTSYADDELVRSAIMAGAAGYVLKQANPDNLLRAIIAVYHGEALLDPATTARLLSRVREADRKAEEDAFRDLTDRELEILVEVARGKTNVEIGQILSLSENTVRNYLRTIFEKLHLTNRIELAAFTYQHHLFEKMGRE
jgi:DNA-binding NarL/FixJ family response regulator